MKTEVVLTCKEGDEDIMINFETREAVAQNLNDAVCSTDTIADFLAYYHEESVQKQLILLENYRKKGNYE